MGFSPVPKVLTMNDSERRNGQYFALFYRIRQLCRRGTLTLPYRFVPGWHRNRRQKSF